MSIEENKAIVGRFIKAVNEQNAAVLDQVLTPDLAQRWKAQAMPWLYNTFAGHQMTITDLIAEKDKVVARLATSGKHSGELEGIPPTGKEWTNTGVYFIRLSEGQIVECDALFDMPNLLKQLGAKIVPAS